MPHVSLLSCMSVSLQMSIIVAVSGKKDNTRYESVIPPSPLDFFFLRFSAWREKALSGKCQSECNFMKVSKRKNLTLYTLPGGMSLNRSLCVYAIKSRTGTMRGEPLFPLLWLRQYNSAKTLKSFLHFSQEWAKNERSWWWDQEEQQEHHLQMKMTEKV